MNEDSPLADALRARVHLEWQQRVCEALRSRGWQPPRYEASGGPVPWEEVAGLAVETVWSDLEPIVGPVVDLVEAANVHPSDASRKTVPEPTPAPPDPGQPVWLSADEVAPLLQTTSHSLRRLAREGRSPVLVRRIGGRWWFARRDLDRFLDTRPAEDMDARDGPR